MEKSARLDKVLRILLTGTISAPTCAHQGEGSMARRKRRQMRWAAKGVGTEDQQISNLTPSNLTPSNLKV